MRHDLQGFDKEIFLKFVSGEKNAILTRSFHYTDKDGVKYTAPAGMPTDGASIPRFFYRVIDPPFASPYLSAAIIHDKICDDARHLAENDYKSAKILRKEGDCLFREMLLFLGCPRVKAWAMYRAVRIGALNLRNNKRAE
jgi:hypothetical protein